MADTAEPGKTNNSGEKFGMQKLNCGFYIAIVGLGLTTVTAIAMMVFNFTEASDIGSILGLYTSVIGTLVGAFIGAEIGASGKEQTEKMNLTLEKEKAEAQKYFEEYKRGLNVKLKEVETDLMTFKKQSKGSIPEEELEEVRAKLNRMMSSSNYFTKVE